MSSSDTFDRQFRRTARAMRRRPAPGGWDRIEARLDRRNRPGTVRSFFGLRPWMIAAIVLLFAGAVALSSLPSGSATNLLAQRAQSVEELNTELTTPVHSRIPDYSPLREGRTDGYLLSPTEARARLAVSPKYRL